MITSGAPRAIGASACSGFLGDSQMWSQVGSEHPWHREAGGSQLGAPQKLGLALAALWQALSALWPLQQGSHIPLPTRVTWFLPSLPAAVPGVALPSGRAGMGTMGQCPPPALQTALLPAACGGWWGRGMAAICRARLNNRPPRKISCPLPQPSIVFETHCCFFQLLSYFSLTFFPDLRHMPSPCPAALN